MAVLEVADLEVTRGARAVVQGISFAVDRGESVTIMFTAALLLPVVHVAPFCSVPVPPAIASLVVVPVPSSSFQWLTRTDADWIVRCPITRPKSTAKHTDVFARQTWPRLII